MNILIVTQADYLYLPNAIAKVCHQWLLEPDDFSRMGEFAHRLLRTAESRGISMMVAR